MTEFQLIVAELSLALAGFSGVVVVMNKQFGTATEGSDTFGLVYILLCSGAALIFSLTPFALNSIGVSQSASLSGTGIALAICITLVGSHAAFSALKNLPRYPLLFWPLLIAGILGGVVHLLAMFGVVPQANLYPALLLWLLVVAFVQFSVFIYVQWIQTQAPPPD